MPPHDEHSAVLLVRRVGRGTQAGAVEAVTRIEALLTPRRSR